ncbi:hypothetical protein HYC85_030837 [Camellia sinensis]|uniref:Uncharacterized protein n=1 Tax=Camellia sinensis TaxID=4442 RepID=A0A7J7G5U2_CAMSI|nr:hypothetical protein HYC85_030837 [Camellia sinensis]
MVRKPAIAEDLLIGMPDVVTIQSTPSHQSVHRPKRVKKAKAKAKVTFVPSNEERDPEDSMLISKLAEIKKIPASTYSTKAFLAKKPRSIGPSGEMDILPEDAWLPEIN